MKPARLLRTSARALLVHRFRAALAAGSVAIGVAAVLVTSALGQGARDAVLRDVACMGTNLLVVRPGQVEVHVARQGIRGRVTTLRLSDAEAVSTLPAIGRAAPGAERQLRIEADRRSMSALVMGTSSSFVALRGLSLRAGRFLQADEDGDAPRVAVVGARVAETLFPQREAVGETLRIAGTPFVVVGVLMPRGVLADGSDEDGNVFVPVRTALRRLLGTTWLSSLFVSVRDAQRMDEAEAQIRAQLRERHRIADGAPDDFDVQNQARLVAMRQELAESLSILALGLGGAALVVGGTGILAFMTLSVRERGAEIGLRTALGARRQDVFVQFLVEASVLAVGGWLGGAALAGAVLAVVASSQWSVALPVPLAALSLLFTAAAGLGLGAFPARRAAGLPPVEALRAAS